MQCPVDELARYTWNDVISGEQVVTEADSATTTPQTVTLTGDVVAKRGREAFYGEHVVYHRDTGDIQSSQTITYGTPDFAARANNATYSLTSEKGNFTDLTYYSSKNNVVGKADKAVVNNADNTEVLTRATYSTCPRQSHAWSIHAKELHLDHNSNIGEAWHATFRVADVPVFYFPYLNFPLDDQRKTGLLLPSVSLSEGRGVDMTLPYYINIAPNQDATLYPRFMTKRGLMLGGEYRYLLEDLSGQFSGTYLSNDKKYNDKRWSFSSHHTYRPNNQLTLSAQYQRVSDKSYLDDFVDTLDLSNQDYLESHLTAEYKLSDNYRLMGQIKHYQVADSDKTTSDAPYNTWPRLLGTGNWRLDNGLVLTSNTELTNFDKDDTVSGWRFDQELTASYPITRTYGFLKPEATYRFTNYRLRDQDSDVDAHQTRAIPTFSLDSGLYFDRQMTWFGHNASQTLEPRLYYLYTPYRDQSDIPDFDTSDVTLSYNSLFLNNRFYGKDRIGDANQLTTAVSSTITDNSSGKELAQFSVGQIQYFSNRRVSLSDSIAKTSRSDIFAESRLQLTDSIALRGLARYDVDDSHTEKSVFGITYTPDNDKAINFSHLYNEDDYKQIDFSGVWRINDQWRAFWRWNYSIDYHKTADILAGVEYADCCWGVRLMARQQRDSVSDDSEAESSIYLEFILNGLGNVGSSTTSELRNAIPQYRPISYETP